jgi:hypothetical protein
VSPSALLAESGRETVSPAALVRLPGLRNCGARLAAVTVTRYGLLSAAVVAMLPEIRPLELSMLRPEGSPVAL